MMTTDTDRARSQAEAQLRSIERMLERIEHIGRYFPPGQHDDPDGCELTSAQIAEGLGLYESSDAAAERAEYHDEDEAQQAIDEHPLSVLVRSLWVDPGGPLTPGEYEILLMTGGPAVRIVGELDENGEPYTARLEYQDWGTPWTEYGPTDGALLNYAARFWYAGG